VTFFLNAFGAAITAPCGEYAELARLDEIPPVRMHGGVVQFVRMFSQAVGAGFRGGVDDVGGCLDSLGQRRAGVRGRPSSGKRRITAATGDDSGCQAGVTNGNLVTAGRSPDATSPDAACRWAFLDHRQPRAVARCRTYWRGAVSSGFCLVAEGDVDGGDPQGMRAVQP
jgi:hypothetical protein